MDHKVTVTSSTGTVTYYIMEVPTRKKTFYKLFKEGKLKQIYTGKEDKHMKPIEVLDRIHEIALEEDVLIAELWLCAEQQGYL